MMACFFHSCETNKQIDEHSEKCIFFSLMVSLTITEKHKIIGLVYCCFGYIFLFVVFYFKRRKKSLQSWYDNNEKVTFITIDYI